MLVGWVGAWVALLLSCLLLGAVALAGDGELRTVERAQRLLVLVFIFAAGFAVGAFLP